MKFWQEEKGWSSTKATRKWTQVANDGVTRKDADPDDAAPRCFIRTFDEGIQYEDCGSSQAAVVDAQQKDPTSAHINDAISVLREDHKATTSFDLSGAFDGVHALDKDRPTTGVDGDAPSVMEIMQKKLQEKSGGTPAGDEADKDKAANSGQKGHNPKEPEGTPMAADKGDEQDLMAEIAPRLCSRIICFTLSSDSLH